MKSSASKTPLDRTARMDATMRVLAKKYTAPAASSKESAFASIVFTMLSARTRDDQTEIVFRTLLAKYPTPQALAQADVQDVTRILSHIGLFRAKAKNVVALAKKLVVEFGGEVPHSIDEMVTLPGVGRKTANCVMVYAFGVPAMCVDTHVHRIANRLGWVASKDVLKTEMQLRARLPQTWWLLVNNVLIQFGREICVPGKPKCWKCPVRDFCAYKKKTPAPSSSRVVE